MNTSLRIPLSTSPEQLGRLLQLQAAFAEVCNVLSPQVKATRCWNRVALHHMAYKALREQFPAMGSQMVCNAIYSVSRAARMVYQHPQSPFNLARLGDKPLPLLQFSESSPVYFDRHTLSIKGGRLSMYTLDGRMHFQLDLKPEAEADFQNKKLREVILERSIAGNFELAFTFSDDSDDVATEAQTPDEQLEIPEYVLVKEAA